MKYLQHLSPTNRFAQWNALACFIIGTISLLSYIIFKNDHLIDIGIIYLYSAVIWNVIVLILVIIMAIKIKTALMETVKTIAIMLLNIPIAIGYFFIVLEFAL